MNIDKLKHRLGRYYYPDDRDKGFMMKSIVPKETPGINYKYWWPSGWWGDQGYTPQCVAYSWAHWLAEGHITQKESRKNGSSPIDPEYLYNESQKVDMWEGENYDGTSVRAGAKILKNHGFISEYLWAWDLNTTIRAILTSGPVVAGTWWYSDMFFPDKKGIINVSGDKMGGHAYLLDGVNTDREIFRIKNSWGRNWGNKGFGYISFDDMEKLILDYGEICLAKEIDKKYM